MMNEEIKISGRTQVCGIFGDPVEHTISPVMHNAAFHKLGLDYMYVPFRVREEDLGPAVQGLRAMQIRGINITIPHKVSVMPFLDELDTLAEYIGAVNTIVNTDGWLKGYNTDAPGFLRALLEKGGSPEGKNIVILGAGGAARGIAFILADKGTHLTIINRHPGPAQDLAGRLSSLFRREVKALELNRKNLKIALDQAEILVNTTSLGMYPGTDETPVPSALLKPGLMVFDIVYNPHRTRLLKEAEERGALTIGGVEMLVWQGVVAFELWTGHKAPVKTMRKAVKRALNINED